jgi:transposase
MNARMPTIVETASELSQRMRSEDDKQKRIRLHALYLVASSQASSRKAVAVLLGVDQQTVGSWFSLYSTGGMSLMLTIGKSSGCPTIFTGSVKDAILHALAQPEGFSSYDQIVQLIKTMTGMDVPYKTVFSYVHDRLKASPKTARPVHPKKTKVRSGYSKNISV